MYYEDMDLCRRGKDLGLQVTLLNYWKCIHSHGKASRKNDQTKILTKSEVIISSHIYLEKHLNNSFKPLEEASEMPFSVISPVIYFAVVTSKARFFTLLFFG